MSSLVDAAHRGYLLERLQNLSKESNDSALAELLAQTEQIDFLEIHDGLNTRLMDIFKTTCNPGAFSLLYELNYQNFLSTIYQKIRRYYYLLDPSDILQEVFFNIYRYPYNFNSERSDAFRHWTYTIIRNTIIKHLKMRSKVDRIELAGEGLSEKIDIRILTPLRSVLNRESEAECSKALMLYLYLYLNVYNNLSVKERKALFYVEVQELSYKRASEHLHMKLENLKMVIFRARKKIFRSMKKYFATQPEVWES